MRRTAQTRCEQNVCVSKVCVSAKCVCLVCVLSMHSLRTCSCSPCVSVPHLVVVVRTALVAQRVLVGENGGSGRNVPLELGIRGVVDLVVTRESRVEVGDAREQVVEHGVGQRGGDG